jgi:hypothetical protein
MLGPSVVLIGSPIALFASIFAVRKARFGIASRTALAISSVECLLVVAVLTLPVIVMLLN